MQVEPQAARFRSEVTPDGYRVVIPARRNWFIVLFLCAWLGGWAFGELSASGELLRGGDKTPFAFLSFWLVGWTIGGLYAGATVLWQLAGREIITVSLTTLSYRAEALGLGRTRSFQTSEVKDLRSTEYAISTFTNQRAWFPPVVGSGFGPVAFDYGARTFRVAPSLDEAEAKLLVRELSARLPGGSR
jgi:hypothetical protein